jgi:hypothetical protein
MLSRLPACAIHGGDGWAGASAAAAGSEPACCPWLQYEDENDLPLVSTSLVSAMRMSRSAAPAAHAPSTCRSCG